VVQKWRLSVPDIWKFALHHFLIMWKGTTTCAAIVALAHCVTVTEAFSLSSPALALSGEPSVLGYASVEGHL